MLNLYDSYALGHAKTRAYSISRKIPLSDTSWFTVEDLTHDLFIDYWRYKKTKYSNTYAGIRLLLGHRSINKISSAWDRHHVRSRNKDFHEIAHELFGAVDKPLIGFCNDKTPESIYFMNEEIRNRNKKVLVLRSEVKRFCSRFQIEFDAENPLSSLIKVLNKTLNKMSDEEFARLPFKLQRKLAQYGEILSANNLRVVASGRARYTGITEVIRSCIQQGIYDKEDIQKELDRQQITYSNGGLDTTLWREKKRAGIPIKYAKTGVVDRMRELFDYGRGVTTIAEMSFRLKQEGFTSTSKTIRKYVYKFRRIHGLTRRSKSKRHLS